MKAFLVVCIFSHLKCGLGSKLISPAVKPRIQTTEKVYQIKVGGEVKLECSVQNLGSMVLMWKQGPRVITAGEMMVRRDTRLRLEGTDLIISKLETADSGQYDCEIEGDSDQLITVSHRLDILIPPQISSEPADGRVVVKKGSSVTIKCLTSGNPRPTVSWSKVNEKDVVGHGEVMELREVSRHHEGVYECVASNGVGEKAVSQIQLKVLYSPEVRAEEGEVNTGVGHQAILVCQVHASPEAEVTWYRNTMLLENDNRMYREKIGSKHTLTIHQVREEEFTSYHCKASNSLGHHSVKITISGKPGAPIVSPLVEVVGGGNYRVAWNTHSYASVEQYRLLYRKAPSSSPTGHSFAWTSVIIPGPRHTRIEDDNNKRAGFLLTGLEVQVDFQLQLQARNSFGWGKVSEQFNFRTNKEESLPVEDARKGSLLYRLNSGPSAFSSSCFYLLWLLPLLLATCN